MHRYGKPVAITTTLAMLAPLLLIACSQVDSGQSVLKTVAIEPYVEIATPIAKEWASDSYLVRARLPLWLEPKMASSRVSLSFRSKRDRTIWLLVIIKGTQGGELSVETEEGVFNEPRPPANPAGLPGSVISSEDAAEFLSTEDVMLFFRENRDSLFPSLNLEYANSFFEQQPLIWTANLASPEAQHFLIVEINAQTGELIRSFDPSNPGDAQ